MVGPRGLRHFPRPRPAAGDRPRSPAAGQVLPAQATGAGLQRLLLPGTRRGEDAGPRELRRRAGRPPALAVIDELPYLLAHSPELQSVIQLAVDERRESSSPPSRLILCGSALATM